LQPGAGSAAASVYPSKRDAWLAFVVWMVSLLSLGAALLCGFATRAEPPVSAFALALCLGAPAFVLWSFYGTSYTLLADQLLIRSGPFRFRVPLAEITSVAPSRSPKSSPACSLDRLEIRYRGDRSRILISPEDKAGFLEALGRRCGQLVPKSEGLVLQGRA
jgi:PH (Pleckstrin Homology) domain-containing protein